MQLEKIRAGSECKGAGKQAVIEYRQEKLSVNLKKLGRMKICILGAGAVGSHIAEALYQHGAGLYGGCVTLVGRRTWGGPRPLPWPGASTGLWEMRGTSYR